MVKSKTGGIYTLLVGLTCLILCDNIISSNIAVFLLNIILNIKYNCNFYYDIKITRHPQNVHDYGQNFLSFLIESVLRLSCCLIKKK